MVKHEQAFITKFNKWLRHNWNQSGPIEVKVSKTGRININQFADHQIAALLAKKIVWKIPDAGWSNLFDIVTYSFDHSWVCLVFNVETSKKFYILNAKTFIKFFKNKIVSMTEAEAALLARVQGSLP